MVLTWEIIYAAVVVFAASIIRGYSGFGFALIVAISLCFIFPPALVTPVILCLDIVASSWLLYKAFAVVDWKGLKLLVAGAALTLPIGTFALVYTPVKAMKILISVVIIILCTSLLIRKATPKPVHSGITFATGLFSGVLTGIAGIGGPPVILYYYSSKRPIAVSRASMITFFLLIDSLALVSLLWGGLLNRESISLSATLLIPSALGIWLGNSCFGKVRDEEKFKKRVLLLLLLIAGISLLTSL